MANTEIMLVNRAKLQSDIADIRCMGVTRDGTRCRQHKVKGSEFCTQHANLEMVRVPEERGRYAGRVGDMDKDYQEAMQDKFLLHLRDEISVLDARTKDLLSQAKTGVNADAWAKAQAAFAAMKRAIAKDDAAGTSAAIRAMNEAFTAARLDLDLWRDIERTMELRRKLVETEQKYLIQTNQMIPSETVIVLLSSLITAMKASVRKYVASKELEEAIILDAQREYESIVGNRPH